MFIPWTNIVFDFYKQSPSVVNNDCVNLFVEYTAFIIANSELSATIAILRASLTLLDEWCKQKSYSSSSTRY